MKKYLIAAVLLFATGAPSAYAQFDYTCNPPCSAGMYCNSDKTCVSISQTLTQQPSSGGININFLKPYGDSIISIINTIFIPVLIAIAFIVFLWGVYKYFIYHGDSESDKMDGRKYAMWGIIGLAVIFSVWALVNILMGALNLQGGKPPPIPKL
ncbi:MAG: pilin [Patescibacteria group bacterium]